MEKYCRELDTGLHMRGRMGTHLLYLCGDALAGAVLQKKPNNLQVILLGCHVQRSEAILHTARTKTHTITNQTHSYPHCYLVVSSLKHQRMDDFNVFCI